MLSRPTLRFACSYAGFAFLLGVTTTAACTSGVARNADDDGSAASGGASAQSGQPGAGGVSPGAGGGATAGRGGSSAGGTPNNAGTGNGASGDAGGAQGGTAPSAGTGSGGDCPANITLCGSECKNLTIDVTNCGACGTSCRADQSCTAGVCACFTGRTECAGTCIDTSSGAANCGACGRACAAGQVCSQGQCGAGCATGLTRCGTSCVDTTGHQNNCGACGKACPADQMCSASMCRCRTGQASCSGGACQDVLSDEANCGACGMTCATGATCTDGACVCPNEGIVCSGRCVDQHVDAQNCGTCGTSCGSGTSCLFGACIDPNSVNCGGGAQMGNTCTRDAYIVLGKYWVNNNQWGISGASGMQCIFSTCNTGDLVGWGTTWNWSGGQNGVKTYVSLVFGWHGVWHGATTGLPIQISSGRAVNCGWDYSVSASGTYNVSYDLWLYNSTSLAGASPTDEIMIWLNRGGGAGPLGTRQTTVSLGSTSWDLYRGTNGSTNVYSYVRTQSATTAVLNVMTFLNDLVSRGWTQSSKYLASVEAGTEVYSGTGSLTTNGFYCRIQ